MDAETIALWTGAGVLTVAGIAGMVLPVLPGPVLLLAGLVMAAWAENFTYVGPVILSVLALLTILAHGLDFLAGSLGVKRYGASRRAAIGAAIGAFVGLFFGFIGVFLGPFIGAVVGELTVNRNIFGAGRAGIGAWLGILIGTAAKIAIGFSMIGLFVIARLV